MSKHGKVSRSEAQRTMNVLSAMRVRALMERMSKPCKTKPRPKR